MECLSLWQPWASLFAHGQKKIETRSWEYRGRLPVVLAVHAAKRWGADLEDLCETSEFRTGLNAAGHTAADRHWGEALPFGAVVGLVRLVECCDTVGLASRHGSYPPRADEREQTFGDYSPGRFGWVCDRFQALATPIPIKGMQGVFSWDAPPRVEALAAELLRA